MNENNHDCPINITLEMISGRWTFLILYKLGIEKKRFGELKRELPGISQKVLSQTLKEMENNNIISRQEYDEAVLKVEYSLTPLGESLQPILSEMCKWGSNYKSLMELKTQTKVRPARKKVVENSTVY